MPRLVGDFHARGLLYIWPGYIYTLEYDEWKPLTIPKDYAHNAAGYGYVKMKRLMILAMMMEVFLHLRQMETTR